MTLPATCKSVFRRQRHSSLSLYQHQTHTFPLIPILVTAAASVLLDFPLTPATVLLHLSHATSQISHLTGRKLIFSVFPFVQLPLSAVQSLPLSVLPCVAAFYFALLFCYLFLGPFRLLPLLISHISLCLLFCLSTHFTDPPSPPSSPFCFSAVSLY